MGLTEVQKQIFISAIWGFAENAQEVCASEPEDYGVKHKDDFTTEMAVKSGIDTLTLAVTEDGLQGAIDGGYLFDEDDDGEPAGLDKLDSKEAEAFLQRLKVGHDDKGVIEVTETV